MTIDTVDSKDGDALASHKQEYEEHGTRQSDRRFSHRTHTIMTSHLCIDHRGRGGHGGHHGGGYRGNRYGGGGRGKADPAGRTHIPHIHSRIPSDRLPRSLEEAIREDKLLTAHQFQYVRQDEGEQYEGYVKRHQQAFLERFYQKHSNEAW